MLLGCHTAVNRETQLNLLLLSNYVFYKPIFTLGISAVEATSKRLMALLFDNYSEMPHRRTFYMLQ